MIAESWPARWEHITPFMALPADLRRAAYTTNSIENLNRQIRKTIKTRGHFPDEQAATKLIYLAIQRAQGAWKKPYHWTAALRGLKIHFGERLPVSDLCATCVDSPHSPSRTALPRPH